MKIFFLILLILVLVWLWRTKRPGLPINKKKSQATAQPLTMIACTHCAVHVPAGDAAEGKKGMYCSEEHRRISEG